MTFEVENDTQLLSPGKQRPQSTFLSMSPLFEEEKKTSPLTSKRDSSFFLTGGWDRRSSDTSHSSSSYSA